MWANRDWVGSFLPSDTSSGGELAAYARLCNALEGNTTSHALASEEVVAKWREATPAGFGFMFRLPRAITRERRLRGASREVAECARRFEPMLDRMGPCSIPLPASFGPDALPVLTGFLDALPCDFARSTCPTTPTSSRSTWLSLLLGA